MRFRLCGRLAVPQISGAAGVSGNLFTRSFQWDAPASGGSPTGYRIYWGTSTGVHASGPHEDTGTALTETYAAIGLSANTTYYMVARAYNGGGESPDSNEIQVRNGVQIGP